VFEAGWSTEWPRSQRFAAEPAPLEIGPPSDPSCNLELVTFPREQVGYLDHKALRQWIILLYAWQVLTSEQLAALLKKDCRHPRKRYPVTMVPDGNRALFNTLYGMITAGDRHA